MVMQAFVINVNNPGLFCYSSLLDTPYKGNLVDLISTTILWALSTIPTHLHNYSNLKYYRPTFTYSVSSNRIGVGLHVGPIFYIHRVIKTGFCLHGNHADQGPTSPKAYEAFPLPAIRFPP